MFAQERLRGRVLAALVDRRNPENLAQEQMLAALALG
jgi:hypothetical protein